MSEVAVLFQQARDLEEVHSYDAARAIYEKILSIDPNHEDSLYEYSQLLACVFDDEQNSAAEVLRCVQKCIKVNPTNAKALGSLAMILESRGDHKAAREMYERTNQIQPKSVVRLINYARYLEDVKELNDAKQLYEEAVALEPSNVDTLFGLGDLLETMEQPEQAIEIYKQILALDPNHDNAKSNYAAILYWKGKAERKLDHVDAALTLLRSIPFPDRTASANLTQLLVLRELLSAGVSKQKACGYCQAPATLACSICRSTKYCSKVCQQAHWKKHKAECKPPGVQKSGKAHFGFWGCDDCGGQCDCLQRRGHTSTCHHYLNTLRRKGPDCPGTAKCKWLACCESATFISNCTSTSNNRIVRTFIYNDKQV